MDIKFEVLGKPVAKARPRITKKGFAYTPAKTVEYENLVKRTFKKEFKNHKPYEGIVKANIIAVFEIPKSYSKKKKEEIKKHNNLYPHKSDCDNIAKIILDSLNGIAYKDDAQVAILSVNKIYGEKAKVIVEIKEIEKGDENE